MTTTATTKEHESLPPWLLWARLTLGVAQGVALYFVIEHQDALGPSLRAVLSTTLIYVPIMVVGGLGALRWQTLVVWTVVATLTAAGLSWYEVSRLGGDERVSYGPQAIYFIVPLILFVAHHLIQAADEARRLIAPYERYFDLGWRHGAQLLLAILFTGAFWAVLMLGAQLFNLIGITFLTELIQKSWFSAPATCGVFAAAIHLTDLRSGLVRGARALGLILLSWLLPAMAGLAAAFFVALPFTGLEPLWATRAATAILLSAAGVLVVLVNAAYQDGAHTPGFILRWSARIASVLMTPLAVLAAYALFLRISQYGLTPDRIYALAVLAIGICYAIPYLAGAFWPRWMKPLEAGNLASAVAVIIVAVALFSPVADPARLSVSDQMRRFRAGVTSPAQLDLAFLRFEGARYGREALDTLVADTSTESARNLSERAQHMLTMENPWTARQEQDAVSIESLVQMQPATAVLPEGFDASDTIVGMCSALSPCIGVLRDVNGDGQDEVLIGQNYLLWVFARVEDDWRQVGTVQFYGRGPGITDALRAGDVRVVPSQVGDVMLSGQRGVIRQEYGADWPPEADDAPASPR